MPLLVGTPAQSSPRLRGCSSRRISSGLGAMSSPRPRGCSRFRYVVDGRPSSFPRPRGCSSTTAATGTSRRPRPRPRPRGLSALGHGHFVGGGVVPALAGSSPDWTDTFADVPGRPRARGGCPAAPSCTRALVVSSPCLRELLALADEREGAESVVPRPRGCSLGALGTDLFGQSSPRSRGLFDVRHERTRPVMVVPAPAGVVREGAPSRVARRRRPAPAGVVRGRACDAPSGQGHPRVRGGVHRWPPSPRPRRPHVHGGCPARRDHR